MKKSKLLIVAASALLAFTAFASGCKEENVTYGEWVITNFPTETASGTIKRVSTDGKKTEEISIPAVSDTEFWTKLSELKPTHTEEGRAEYECEYGKVTVKFKPLGHNYDGVEAQIITLPTTETEGKAVFVCKDGDGGQNEVVLPAINDKDYSIKKAGHDTPGTATFKCEYGKVVIELQPTGHVFSGKKFEITVAPTLTEKGTALEYCNSFSSEGDHAGTREVEVPTLSDEEVWTENTEKAVLPTHTTEGKRVFKSTKYGEVTLVVEALGHDYESDHKVEVKTMPTLNAPGVAIEYCADYESEADEVKGSREIEIPVLTDESVWTVTKTVYHAKQGKAVYTSVYGTVEIALDPVGHDYESDHRHEMIEAPTLAKPGVGIEYCADYENEAEGEKGKKEVVIPSLSDEEFWNVTTVAPTHTKEGAYIYKSAFGEISIKIKASGHNYEREHKIEVLKAPGLYTSGTAIEYCADYDTEEEKGTQEIVIPELTNARVWTKTTLAPDYYHGTRDVYTSVYGETVIEHDDRIPLPYESKSYVSVMLNAYGSSAFGSEYKRGKVDFDANWKNNTPFAISKNGTGIGEAHPFTIGTKYEFYDYDMQTGKISIKELPRSSKTTTDEDGNVTIEHYYDEQNAVIVTAYIDFATGIMIKPAYKDYNYSVVAAPYASGIDENKSKASAWDKAIALSLVYNDGEEKTRSAFVFNGTVYFGVVFTDINGNAVAADECYGAAQVYVKDANGSKIAAFGWNGSDMTELDGNEGEYTLGEDKIAVSGTGLIYKNGALVAKYALVEENVLGVTALDGSKYELYTLDKSNKTVQAKLPAVTVEYDLSGVTVSDESVFAGLEKTEKGYKNANFNKNTALTALVPKSEGKVFFGWKTADGKAFTDGTVVSADLVLIADWRNEIILYYIDADGTKTEIKAAEGVRIGNYLPALDDRFDAETLKYYQFAGWNIGGNDVPLDTPVAKGAAGKTLEATWKELSAYVGTYNGGEIWNGGYGNSGGKTLTISSDGKISGFKTGTIVSYDPVSGRITWKKGNNECYFWFDVRSGVIAGFYSDNKIGNDLYVFGNAEYQTNGKMAATYGVWDPDTKTWEAQFATVNTRNGLTDVFMYKNHIYSNVSITDAAGKKLAVADIKNSKTVVVTDLDNGTVLIRIATTAENFGKVNNSSSNKALDEWAGSYAFGEQTVVLDGTGNITYGDKTGTYAKVEGKDYDFDAYFANNTEYMRLTLDGSNCTLVKPLVKVAFEIGGKTLAEGDAEKVAEKDANVNIALTLPSLKNIDGFVFRGWYVDPMFITKADAEIVPTADTTLYALWMEKRTLTVVIGENNSYVQEYAKGEKTVVEKPSVKGWKFLGWYTTATCDKGTEWVAGKALTENVTVYAKWTEAPAYNNTYVATENEVKNDDESGESKLYTWNSAVLDIDTEGQTTCTAYPFRGEVSIKEQSSYADDGALVLAVGSSEYPGYIDKKSGIIIIATTSDEKATFKEVYFLNPFETGNLISSLLSSYWLGGEARAIEYKYDGKTYTAFVMGEKVYFNVSFKGADAKTVKADVAYSAETLYVCDENGNEIVKYISDGTNLKLADGLEGEYTVEGTEDKVVLNGVNKITLGGKEGTYSVASGKGYNVEAYVDGSYYRVNADKKTATCTVNKPMVEIAYNLNGVAIDSAITPREQRNVNIKYVLPAPTSASYILRGWYLSGDEKTLYTEYAPSVNVMFYAKWDKKVTLTVVYGNGLATEKSAYGAGDKAAPVQPGYTNGKVFDGWYTDEACTKAYTPGVINENTTIYCKWLEAVPYFGDYVGYNIYGTSGNGSIGTGSVKASVDALGKASGKFSGTIVKNVNGSYKLSSGTPIMIDEINGIIVTPYNTNKTIIGTDWYVYIKNAASYSGNKANDQFVWNEGNTKLTRLTVKYTDGTAKEMIIFFHDGKVYGNATWQCEGVSAIGKLSTSSLSKLVVKDSNGNVVYGA